MNEHDARAGWPLALTREETLCTMRLARAYGAPAKLGECCAHYGVELADVHAALADAEATAAWLAELLVMRVAPSFGRRRSGTGP